MFERFSDRARRVMHLANQFAGQDECDTVWPAHILCAIVAENGGVAMAALKQLNVKPHQILTICNKQSRPLSAFAPGGTRVPLSVNSKELVRYATEEAKNLSHNYVGTEHLLLGFLRLYFPIHDELLQLGVTYDSVRDAVLNLLRSKLEEQIKNAPPEHLQVLKDREATTPPDGTVREVLELVKRLDWAALKRLCEIAEEFAVEDTEPTRIGDWVATFNVPVEKEEQS